MRSFLWSTRGEPASYFFGTIHVPYTRVWDHVPENAKRAFGNADRVVFELDLLDPGTLAALANCQLLPEGRSLADVLPPELLARLRRYCAAHFADILVALERNLHHPFGDLL